MNYAFINTLVEHCVSNCRQAFGARVKLGVKAGGGVEISTS
jgi:hypothetical protein